MHYQPDAGILTLDTLSGVVEQRLPINAYGKNMYGPVAKVEPVVRKLHKAGKGVIGMKLIGEGAFRNSDEKRDNSIRYVLGLGCVDAMVVGFEKVEEIDDFAARVGKVSTALIKKA